MKVSVNKKGKVEKIDVQNLSNSELCHLLGYINEDVSDYWFLKEGKILLKEAIRRLKTIDKVYCEN